MTPRRFFTAIYVSLCDLFEGKEHFDKFLEEKATELDFIEARGRTEVPESVAADQRALMALGAPAPRKSD